MINANGTENGANGVNYGVNDDTNDIEVPVLQAFRDISHFVWYCKAVSDLS